MAVPLKEPNEVTMEMVKQECPAFRKGKACPYKCLDLKGLGVGCPEFQKGTCPFQGIKTMEEFKAKLGEMRDKCQGRENYTKALDMIYEASKNEAAVIGHCPFMTHCCRLKTDMHGKPILDPNDTTMDRIKEVCPAFRRECPYKCLKLEGLADCCPEFKDGCPFKGVKTVGEFKVKLGEMRDKCKGTENYTKALDMFYEASKEEAAIIGHCPFMAKGCHLKTDKNGKPILNPCDFTMDRIKQLCPAFRKGKACPYKGLELKGLGAGCPEFKYGCPFKSVKSVEEFKGKLGEMRDKCKGTESYTKVLDMIYEASKQEAAVIGHCPFMNHVCQLKSDTHGKPVLDPSAYTMDRIKKLCPAFQKGKACPYKGLDFKGLATGCPMFKEAGDCPFKDVKSVGEFQAKLGEMRDKCKGKKNYTKALDMIYEASKGEAEVIGDCPFMNHCCPLKSDKHRKPILVPAEYTMDRVKQLCPAFKKGKACPYKGLDFKGLATGCPMFKKPGDCPFKDVKSVGEFQAKLGEMRDKCKGKENYTKALDMIYEVSKKEAEAMGHCSFLARGCCFKRDMNGKPILAPADYSLDRIKQLCPAFQKGKACPYKCLKCLKGLGVGCPLFNNGCPFKEVKTVGEFEAKLGEMRDKCKGTENYTKALDMMYLASKEGAAEIGHCSFMSHCCHLKADMDGKPILDPTDYTLGRIQDLCPAFEGGKACPYKELHLKGLAAGCPAFNLCSCPFQDVKTVADFKTKLGEMRDNCKGKEGYTKALHMIYEASKKEAEATHHCSFLAHGCYFKTDMNGKPILDPNDYTMDQIKQLCPAFEKGKACPYKDLQPLKGLATGCPKFKDTGCPFKDVKTVGEFKDKLGEMRDNCKGKENYSKALHELYGTNVKTAGEIGHCPFHQPCQLKTDRAGNPILNK